ncbi:sulfatase [Ruminococcus sp. OA3]|uniref:sulfatase n=1 Tax=Ruminococcus sp. OA3 TaxID=2914164 RepID=UPI001F063982|nr:sulfatase [Ruminococcus sp. OA3]MCH1984522.1 sulfatase [Ruminococcus sp. OA3]
MKTVFILCDTVNRRMLDIYNSNPAETAQMPNLDRLAQKGMVFDNHWCGSAPCMPARKDIMTGRLNFLEKPWGAIEPYEQTLQNVLAEKNVHTMMFSDHSHYLIPGGENYTKGFTAWEVFRGQEGDSWCVPPDQGGIRKEVRPKGFKGEYSASEEANRQRLKTEKDYPSVKTLSSAAEWLEQNHQADNFMLWVEAFDPHEPYDVPEKYLDLYEKDYIGFDVNHPDYQPNIFTREETQHLKNRCKALMTMTDAHIGEILDVLDAYGMWKDTMVIFTTDHGFHLGEHGYMAKNYMAPYNEVFHIPLIICKPGCEAGRSQALTQNIDVMPTMLDYFGADKKLHYPLHGKSLMPVLDREARQVRSGTIFGYFGKQVGYTDGTYVYIKAAKDDRNRPLNVYTAVPSILRQYFGADDAVSKTDYDKIEMGRFLSWTNYPVYKIPADIINFRNPSQEFSCRSQYNGDNLLFHIKEDYLQEYPISDEKLERKYIRQLRDCMQECDAPGEQFERLGI